MNTAIMTLVGATPAPAMKSDPGPATVHGEIFAALVAARPPSAAAPKSGPLPAPDIAATIAGLRTSGATHAQIIDALAAQLADSIGAQLGISDPAGRAALRKVFATALAPPGDPGGGDDAALAARATQLAQTAAALVEALSGQQKRIAGTTLDAATAKDHPASNIDRHLQPRVPLDGSASASASGAPSFAAAPGGASHLLHDGAASDASSTAAPDAAAVPAPVAAAVSPVVAGAVLAPASEPNSGRTARSERSSVTNGGDTAVGRLLVRAANAQDARLAAVAPRPPQADAGSGQARAGASPDAAAVSGKNSAKPSLDAFVAAFTAATSGETPAAPAGGAAHAVAAVTPDAGLVPAPAATPPAHVERAAPIAATSHPMPLDQSAVVDRIVRGVTLTTTGTSSEVRLTLVPETLGDISVKLVVGDSGVSAHIVAQTPEARDTLISAAPQLSKALADAGLKLQNFSVDWSGSGFAGSHGQQQRDALNDGGRRRPALRIGAVDASDASDEELDAVPSFAPPSLHVAADTGYDYLA